MILKPYLHFTSVKVGQKSEERRGRRRGRKGFPGHTVCPSFLFPKQPLTRNLSQAIVREGKPRLLLLPDSLAAYVGLEVWDPWGFPLLLKSNSVQNLRMGTITPTDSDGEGHPHWMTSGQCSRRGKLLAN